MGRTLQIKRGTTAKLAEYAGPFGEPTFDTDRGIIVIQNETAGGIPQGVITQADLDEQTAALGNEIWVNAQNIQQLKLT